MRVLIITQDFPPRIGGVQTYSYEIARNLHGLGQSIEVAAPLARGARRFDSNLPFRVHRLPIPTGAMPAAAPAAVVRIASRGRFDVALATQWMTAGAGLLAKRLGIVGRVFAAAHGRELLVNHLGRIPLAGRCWNALRAMILARSDGFFPVSRFTAGLLSGLGVEQERLHVVHNGTDLTMAAGADGQAWRRRHGLEGAPLLLTLARLVPHKGIDTVLRALPAIRARVPQVRYAIVGEGPDRGRLQDLARTMGVGDRVTFTGLAAQGDIGSCLAACDVFVMPSRLEPPHVEGFGLVFLDAAALGKPAVGTTTGGIPDAVVDGETGFLVEPDDAQALAQACASLLADPELARRVGLAARARVEREGSWRCSAEKILEAIRGCA